MARTQRERALLTAYKERPVVGGVCAIRNTATGRVLLFSCLDPKGKQNRFSFAVSTGTCIEAALQKDWRELGPAVFTFETLETLEKKPDQTDRDYREELALLLELWRERLAARGDCFYGREGEPAR